MKELDEIREDIDDLRGRVIMLEFDRDVDRSSANSARVAARAADRQVSRSRSDVLEGFAKLEAGVSQLSQLLTDRLNQPRGDQP